MQQSEDFLMGEESSVKGDMHSPAGFEPMQIDTGEFSGEADTTARHEFWLIFRRAAPLGVTFLLQSSLATISLLFAGRLGSVEMAGLSMGNVTFGVTSAILYGLATCLDTVCPRAYGAGNYEMVGLYFQRGVALSAVLSLPLIALWYNAGRLLGTFVQDAGVVRIASTYLRYMILTLPGFILFECGSKFLQAQGDFVTSQHILFICTPLDILLNYIFVIRLKLGYVGSPIAIVLTYSTMGLLAIGYILYQDRTGQTECWHPIRTGWQRIFQNWGQLIALAIPGIIMLESEFFAFEVITFISALFGTEILAAQSIVASVQTIFFQLPFSFSVAASNRIAYHVGSRNLNNCQISTKTTICYIATFASMINFIVLYFGRYKICSLFTKDKQLIDAAGKIVTIVAINQVYDVFNVMAAGVLRAQGRQKIGGYLNLIAYYLIGLETGVFLAFKLHMEVRGLWIGLGIGIFILALGENFFVYTSDWRHIINKSEEIQDEDV